MSKGKALARNSLIIGAGKIFTSLVGFIALPFYVSLLSAESYGLLDVIIVYAALFSPMISLRLELSIFRWIVDGRGDDISISKTVSVALRILIRSMAVATLIFCIVGLIFDVPYALLVYLYIISIIAFNVLVQIPRGLGDNVAYTIANVLLGFFSTGLGLLFLVVFEGGVGSVLTGYVVGNTIAVIYIALQVGLVHMINGVKDRNLARSLLSYSIPMIPDQLSNLGIYTATKVIVASALGLVASGLYAVTGRFASILLSALDVFEVAWIESASVHIDSPDRDKYFNKVTDSAISLFFGMATGLLVLIAFIFPLIIDKEFHEAYYYIPILMIGYLGNTLAKIFGAVFLGLKDTRSIMKTTMTAGVISLVGTFATINIAGLWAPVIFVSIAYYSLAFMRHRMLVNKGINITLNVTTIVRTAAVFAVGLVVYYAPLPFIDKVGLSVLCLTLVAVINCEVIMFTLGLVRPKTRKG